MCGIAGVLSSSPVDAGLLTRMRDSIAHRGPDHGANWFSPDQRVGLAHRRLAIIDLTPLANQPFTSWDGRFTIVFNGEIYNFRKLRAELSDLGCRFQTQSDTEVIIEAFRIWGHSCPSRLFGMFAFAIWDAERHTLFCGRDRTGEKPFHYCSVGGEFLFASELKSLTFWPGFRKCLNTTAVIDYLTYGFVPDPKTIWQGSHKLPPGHCLEVKLLPGAPPEVGEPLAYWDMTFRPDHSEKNWDERIRVALQDACQEMSFADVPVGVFLSGGVDSSGVTAGLTKAGCDVRTFSIGFEDAGFDERSWARTLAQQYKTSHSERVVVADDIPQVVDRLRWHFDEPFNDYAYLPMYYLCREARQSITVALSGDGADELFGGYLKYRRLALRARIARACPQPAAKALYAAASQGFGPGHVVTRKLAPYGRGDSEILTDTLVTAFPAEELRSAARGALAQELRNYCPGSPVEEHLRKAPPREVGLLNSMRYLDLKLTLAGDMLVKVDRASMAVALEVRPIYLHPQLLELAAAIPPALLADRQESKKPLKSALREWLPEDLLYRRKMGFALPLPMWLNGKLKNWVVGNSRKAIHDFIDPDKLQSLYRCHQAGIPNLTLRMHSIIMLSNWLEAWT